MFGVFSALKFSFVIVEKLKFVVWCCVFFYLLNSAFCCYVKVFEYFTCFSSFGGWASVWCMAPPITIGEKDPRKEPPVLWISFLGISWDLLMQMFMISDGEDRWEVVVSRERNWFDESDLVRMRYTRGEVRSCGRVTTLIVDQNPGIIVPKTMLFDEEEGKLGYYIAKTSLLMWFSIQMEYVKHTKSGHIKICTLGMLRKMPITHIQLGTER